MSEFSVSAHELREFLSDIRGVKPALAEMPREKRLQVVTEMREFVAAVRDVAFETEKLIEELET